MSILGQFFEHEINIFRGILGSLWTMPSDFIAKNKQPLFYAGLESSGESNGK